MLINQESNGGCCVLPYVLRYLQLELTRFYSNAMSWRIIFLAQKLKKLSSFWYTPKYIQSAKEVNSHISQWAMGESYNYHSILDKIRWRTVEYLLPPHFLIFCIKFPCFNNLKFGISGISGTVPAALWQHPFVWPMAVFQDARPQGAASWAEIGPRFGGLKQASRRVRS